MALTIHIPLNKTEQFIFKDLFKSSLSHNYQPNFHTSSLMQECAQAGFSEEESRAALECLIDRGLVSGTRYMGGVMPNIQLTEQGFGQSCEDFLSDYDLKKELVAKYLAGVSDKSQAQVKVIATETGMPFLVARHFIEFFAALGWVKWQREDDEYAFITYISPLMSRALEDEPCL